MGKTLTKSYQNQKERKKENCGADGEAASRAASACCMTKGNTDMIELRRCGCQEKSLTPGNG